MAQCLHSARKPSDYILQNTVLAVSIHRCAPQSRCLAWALTVLKSSTIDVHPEVDASNQVHLERVEYKKQRIGGGQILSIFEGAYTSSSCASICS